LRPRRVGDDVHVIALGPVQGVEYRAGVQVLTGYMQDAGGNPFRIQLGYRAVAPHALSALQRILGESPTYVTGMLSRTHAGWELAPLAILGKIYCVLDLAAAEPSAQPTERQPSEQQAAATIGSPLSDESAVDAAIAKAMLLMDRAVHRGMRVVRQEVPQAADALLRAGFRSLGERMRKSVESEAATIDCCIALAVLGDVSLTDPGDQRPA
jgi:hypothetical protein